LLSIISQKYNPGSPLHSFLRNPSYTVYRYAQTPASPFNTIPYYRNRDGTNQIPVPDPKQHANSIMGGPGNDLLSSHFMSMLIPINANNNNSDIQIISPFDFISPIQFFGLFQDSWAACNLSDAYGQNIFLTSTPDDKILKSSSNSMQFQTDGIIPDQYKLNLSSTFYSVVSQGNLPAYFNPVENFWQLYPVQCEWYLDTDLGNLFNTSQSANSGYTTAYSGNVGSTPMGALFIGLTIFAALVVFTGLILASFGQAMKNNCAPVDDEAEAEQSNLLHTQ